MPSDSRKFHQMAFITPRIGNHGEQQMDRYGKYGKYGHFFAEVIIHLTLVVKRPTHQEWICSSSRGWSLLWPRAQLTNHRLSSCPHSTTVQHIGRRGKVAGSRYYAASEWIKASAAGYRLLAGNWSWDHVHVTRRGQKWIGDCGGRPNGLLRSLTEWIYTCTKQHHTYLLDTHQTRSPAVAMVGPTTLVVSDLECHPKWMIFMSSELAYATSSSD